jgi:hypothetical protein
MNTAELDTASPPVEDAPPSVRESLEAAISTHAPEDGASKPPEPGGVAALLAAGATPDGPQTDPKQGPATTPAAAPDTAPAPAPASWKAGLREHWKTLTPEVQQEIQRRENEQVGRMRENAAMRQHLDRFNSIVEPYRALMEAEGGEPLAAFHDYLKAATLLRTGAPNDRAAFVAALVQRYGVPLDALDAHLASAIQRGPGAQSPLYPTQQAQMPQQQPQQFRDPRVDAMFQRVEQQANAMVRSEVDSFKADAKHEFFDDVRLTMADVMDAAAKRGIEMSMEDAYQRAIMIEPEVRKVVESRGMRMNASQAARTLAAARHASSSLPSGNAPPAAKLATTNGLAAPSVRQSLEAAIDTLRTSA